MVSGTRVSQVVGSSKDFQFLRLTCVETARENLELLSSFSELSCSYLLDSHELSYWFSEGITCLFIDGFGLTRC